MAIKVCVDQAVDLTALVPLQSQGLIELHQANELEQEFSDVIQDTKGFMIGHTKLGRDVLANKDVADELERIIGPDNRKDIGHIYAAWLNKCEYFVTNDVTDFIKGERREKLESLLNVKIRRTTEFVDELWATPQED